MSGLKRVLEKSVAARLKAGGAVSENLSKALSGYRTRLFSTFLVLFAVLICLVAFGAYGIAVFFKTPEHMGEMAAAMGVSAGGLTELLRRVWKEWSQTELLLVLMEDASEALITVLVDKAIEKL
jgi:hypothetical protein